MIQTCIGKDFIFGYTGFPWDVQIFSKAAIKVKNKYFHFNTTVRFTNCVSNQGKL